MKLYVSLAPSTGHFEVSESGSVVVSGRVTIPNSTFDLEMTSVATEKSLMQLKSSDVYKELRLRGYDYGPTFQGISSVDELGKDVLGMVESYLDRRCCAIR